MPRIPRVIGRKMRALQVGDLVGSMTPAPAWSPSPMRPRDRLAALRKGRATQDSARRLAEVFAELDQDLT